MGHALYGYGKVDMKLSARQIQLMRDIFGAEAVDWIRGIEDENLSFSAIEESCNMLSAKFHMNGIDQDFEANDYGIEIEALIDVLNRPRQR